MCGNRINHFIFSLVLTSFVPLHSMEVEFAGKESCPDSAFGEIKELFITFNHIDGEIQKINAAIFKIQGKGAGNFTKHDQIKMKNLNAQLRSLCGRDYRNLGSLLQAKLMNAHLYILNYNHGAAVFIPEDLIGVLSEFNIAFNPSARIVWQKLSQDEHEYLVRILRGEPFPPLCPALSPGIDMDVEKTLNIEDAEIAQLLAGGDNEAADDFIDVTPEPNVAPAPQRTWADVVKGFWW